MTERHYPARVLLRQIIRTAIDNEGVPLPAIWKGNVTDLCLRVVEKLIGVDAALGATKQNALHPTEEKVGAWLSAALEDPTTCIEMRNDVIAWMTWTETRMSAPTEFTASPA